MGHILVPIVVHAIAAVTWIGGIFFAYTALKPAEPVYTPEAKSKLWLKVYAVFVRWVGCSIAVMWLSCMAVVGMTEDPIGNMTKHSIGLLSLGSILTVTTLAVILGPWQRLNRQVEDRDFSAADQTVLRLRRYLMVNFILGIAMMAFAFTPGLSSIPLV